MTSSKYQNPHLTEWDLRWIQEAEKIKQWSKDPFRKVGCVLTEGNRRVVEGFNGFPSGIPDDRHRLYDQDLKNNSIIHAELNAIAWAARKGVSVDGCSAYITCHPCSMCASMLIEVGIKKVICPSFLNYKGKWLHSFKIASDDLYKAKIPVLYYEPLQ